jgi:hypothetical protein
MVALTRTPEQTQTQTLYKLTHAFDMALHKLIPLHADSDELTSVIYGRIASREAL